MPPFEFNPNELHRLGRAVFSVGHAMLSDAPGARRTRRAGEGTDFMDYREYVAGDDFRKVDWSLYGRLRQVFVRLHEAPRQLSVSLLVDVSRSMNFGRQQTKLSMALRVACAMGFIALRGGDRVFAYGFSDSLIGGIGPLSGAAALPKLIQHYQKMSTGRSSDLTAAVGELRSRRRCKGLLIVISDFLNVAQVETAMSRAMAGGASVLAIQILDELDRGVGLTGDLRLRDSESGEMVDIHLDQSKLDAYQAMLGARRDQLEQFLRGRGQHYTLADTNTHYLELVGRALRSQAILR